MELTPSQEAARDIRDPKVQRELLFSQEPELLKNITYFCTKIRSLPPDPKYPDALPQALVVGGFVRDALLGLHPKDADIEVYGVSPERLEEFLLALFPGKVNLVGKSFGIIKVAIEGGLEIDVSIPRRESKNGDRHGDIAVKSDPAMSVRDAALRRDFTMNTLAADFFSDTATIIDEFGGVQDIAQRTLRATNEERFQDDPLRVYRAVQFAARFELTVEEKTNTLLMEMVGRGMLDHLPKERVTGEIEKMMLKSKKPSIGFELAGRLGIIEKYFPELYALRNVPQEPEWHPEGDVWIHTMMVIDAAARIIREPGRNFTQEEQLEVMLGSLCHDLGKPPTTAVLQGRVRSLGHEEAGVEPTRSLFQRFSFADRVRTAAETVAAEHLKPGVLHRSLEKGELDERKYIAALGKLLRRISPTSPHVLIACSEADNRGRAFPDAATREYLPGNMFLATLEKHRLTEAALAPLLFGRDVLEVSARLNKPIKPGPEIGKILRRIAEKRDEGMLSNREEALTMLESLLA